MSHERRSDPPSPFVVEWIARLAPPIGHLQSALDVAMGRGRHALLMAQAGMTAYGVDLNLDAVRDAKDRAAIAGVRLLAWCADLTESPPPRARFDLVLVTRYLQRDLSASLADALAPGGVLLYETFTVDHVAHGRGPTSPVHLLKRGELQTMFDPLEVMFYEEVLQPDAVARLVARKSQV